MIAGPRKVISDNPNNPIKQPREDGVQYAVARTRKPIRIPTGSDEAEVGIGWRQAWATIQTMAKAAVKSSESWRLANRRRLIEPRTVYQQGGAELIGKGREQSHREFAQNG